MANDLLKKVLDLNARSKAAKIGNEEGDSADKRNKPFKTADGITVDPRAVEREQKRLVAMDKKESKLFGMGNTPKHMDPKTAKKIVISNPYSEEKGPITKKILTSMLAGSACVIRGIENLNL